MSLCRSNVKRADDFVYGLSRPFPLLVAGVTTRDWCTRHGVGASLLLLEICLVVQSLLLIGCHGVLVWGHASGARLHSSGWGRDIGVCVLGRLDSRFTIDAIRVGRFGCVETCLDQVLALGFGHQGLELGGGEGVDETSLRHDEQEDLSTSEDGQFVGLLHDTSLSLGEGDVTTRLVLDELDFNLSSLAAGLVVVVVIVVGGRGVGGALSLDASLFGRNAVVVGRGRVAFLWVGDLVLHRNNCELGLC